MKRSDLGKLRFKKLTIGVLTHDQLREAQGGWGYTQALNCSGSCSNPTATICNTGDSAYCTRFQPTGCWGND